MNILVTGGAGYIGSHTCVELLKRNYSIIVVDNLINSKIEAIDNVKVITKKEFDFYEIDLTDGDEVEKIFATHKIDAVVHFAGLKAIGESVVKPINYYYNNLVSTMILIRNCIKYDVSKFVFSSSATVYGNNKAPLKEDMELLPTLNPYGETKAMNERILTDTVKAFPNFSVSILRYFNPVGAHESGLIGENPIELPNNIMPLLSKVAKREEKNLKIFGNDYDTVDGTGVRDYVHVVDIALGHIAALSNLVKGVNIYNLGTGQGTSVLELIKIFQEVNGVKIPYEVIERRSGDIGICYADTSKAERELNWKANLGIQEMVRDSWYFEKNTHV